MHRTLHTLLLATGAVACVAAGMLAQAKINPTDPQPTCELCPGTYIPLSELDAYTKKAIAEKLVDQQVRDVFIGKAHIGIGMVYRGRLAAPAPDSVAEHDQVSEVYHVISGTATLVLGPDLVNLSAVRPRCVRSSSSMARATTPAASGTVWRTTSRPAT